ncbi:hypothetical protein PACTADRAFT_49703 [Pachysolen tannophilus NRRL Y-2460]|uniref:Thiol-specific monooxygenase n=1 Tax=Pachysolen tannophilus NRRL Y-2460 TaxID=669874 RepID=A0A1E4TX73_PACTA|nr:hypothetical protein PACTADRAFT_49703 [Pachysolen tannophilus NRRL Y-2460]
MPLEKPANDDVKFIPQGILDTEAYSDPGVLTTTDFAKIPDGLTSQQRINVKVSDEERLQYEKWIAKSGIYEDLYTNVPEKYTRFSYQLEEPNYKDETRDIHPFLTVGELSKRFENLIVKEKLSNYIRTNTTVVKVEKNSNKWVLTLRKYDLSTHSFEWYQEEFDAVVIANGHYSLPNIPHIDGLADYNKVFPEKLIHAKSYSNIDDFKGKKVLFVGNSISGVSLIQYAFPVAKEVLVSRRGPHIAFPWVNDAIASNGIKLKPTIEKFLPKENAILFSDGTKEYDVDLVVFATGYHYHFPFFPKDNEYFKVKNASNLSWVSGFYLDDFSIKDPTLTAVGLTVTHLNFSSIEASAAAIAGVWSNAKELPSNEVQEKWVSKRLEATGDNILFHYYKINEVKEGIIDQLLEFAPNGRNNPLEGGDQETKNLEAGFKSSEALFYKFKDGKLTLKS